MSSYLRYLTEPFALVLLPLVSISMSFQNYQDANRVINISARIVVVLLGSIAVIASVASHEILSILFPPSFTIGAPSLSILSIGSLGLGFYYLFSRVMIADERTKHLGALLFIVAIVDFFLTILLTDWFRMEGAALSTAFTFVLMGAASAVYVQHKMNIEIKIGFTDIAKIFVLYILCYFLKIILVSVSAAVGVFFNTLAILLVLATSFVFWILVKPFSEEESNYINDLIASSRSLSRFEKILSVLVKKMSRRNKQ